MSMTRAVCLNCIDGRVQLPVIDWVKGNYKVDHLDMVTEPGMDGVLADRNISVEDVYRKVRISIEKNDARTIFVVGHHDCMGNRVSDDEHKECIQLAGKRLKEEFPGVSVMGLWVNEDFEVEEQV